MELLATILYTVGYEFYCWTWAPSHVEFINLVFTIFLHAYM